MNKLLELGTIPIINQNDTVSTLDVAIRYIQEDMQVCFSDNDKLSSLVASELDADLVDYFCLILTVLYDDNPRKQILTRNLLKKFQKLMIKY